MSRLLAFARMGAFIFLLLCFVSYYLIYVRIFNVNARRRFRIRQYFCRLGMRVLGVKVTEEGGILKKQGPYLVICNHRSLLDPLVCARYIHAFFLSKAEVEDYPLIGAGSKLTGVIFVQRDDKSSRAGSRETIKKTLESGYNVLVYPEGTTNGEDLTKRFYKGSFEIAQEMGVPVIPTVLEYKTRSDYWTDGGLLSKSVEQFSKWKTQLHMWVGEPITAESSAELMRRSQSVMDEKIREVQMKWGNMS